MDQNNLVISCEHGGNQIPPSLTKRFAKHAHLLDTHYGWDPGALDMAHTLADHFHSPLVSQTISRLVVECNRTLYHPQLWSNITQSLPEIEKENWLKALYYPYREALHEALKGKMQAHGRALHISSHTMAHEVNGVVRPMDIALLFDPKRPDEVTLVEAWAQAIARLDHTLVVAFNEPFQGYNDGQVVWLRGMHPQTQYLGIELELNQRWVDTPRWEYLQKTVTQALTDVLQTSILP